MNIIEAIEKRRAVKHFDTQHVMAAEEVEALLGLAMLSPTAFNIQNWRFVVVSDKTLRKEIRAVSWDQAQVTDSSLFIVLCADLKSWEKEPERYWANAPQGVQDFLLPAIENYYKEKHQVQRDEAMRSCGMAAQTLMIAAQSMGYESCPMDGFDFDKVAELIHLPSDHVVAMFVAIGKGTQKAQQRGGQLPMSQVVVQDRFS